MARPKVWSSKSAWQRHYRENNREHLRAKARERYWANPEKHKAARAKYVASNKTLVLARQRSYNHGISPEAFDALLASQGGVCGICRSATPGGKGGWHMDHDHAFERGDPAGHRGVLCHSCNTGMGALGDSVERLAAAIEYLRRYA